MFDFPSSQNDVHDQLFQKLMFEPSQQHFPFRWIAQYLNVIAKTNMMLAHRLAPPTVMQKIQFTNINAGYLVDAKNGTNATAFGVSGGQAQILRPYNGLLVTITAGLLDMSFGSVSTGGGSNQQTTQPDFQFGPTSLPIHIPFIKRDDSMVTFWADSLASTPTSGTIFLVNW